MDSHRLTNQPADSSRRRMGYRVPDASWQRCNTSAPDSSSVGFSRKASSTFSVCRDIRTLRSLPIVVSLHRAQVESKPRTVLKTFRPFWRDSARASNAEDADPPRLPALLIIHEVRLPSGRRHPALELRVTLVPESQPLFPPAGRTAPIFVVLVLARAGLRGRAAGQRQTGGIGVEKSLLADHLHRFAGEAAAYDGDCMPVLAAR